MKLSTSIIALMSYAAAVSALPTTSINEVTIRHEDNTNGADDYPVKWSRRSGEESNGADDYPVKWSRSPVA